MRLVVLSSDTPFASAMRDVLAAQLPEPSVDQLDIASLKTRPVADAVVVDGRADGAAAAALTARLRAMGFTGAIVVVNGSDEWGNALVAAGAAAIRPGHIARELVAALAEQMELSGGEHAAEVMRARRLVAAGEIALKFQHSLNNPLAGILAEAQLLQLDAVTPEQHEALERIVTLCRRIVELGKTLDGMGEKK